MLEILRFHFVRPKVRRKFCIVSAQRNAGIAAVRCLDSVYNLNYDRKLVRQIFIDDASTDDTVEFVERWLSEHTGHNVEFKKNKDRIGLCGNNLKGFLSAEPGSIVLEVNGDDWLPDSEVLNFLNKIYEDENIWITYNTFIFYYGGGKYRRCPTLKPLPRSVVNTNSIREHSWGTSHLHSFRAELATHVNEDDLKDPATGEFWQSGVDRAWYVPMLELAGRHSLPVFRTMYVYNVMNASISDIERMEKHARDARIASKEKYKPLEKLDVAEGRALPAKY